MHPTDNASTGKFSPCSIEAICSTVSQKAGNSCLKLPGALQTIEKGICGNGVREGDEQCDCGTAEECSDDPCCNANCTFKNGAKCSDKNDECCQGCGVKANGTSCRPSSGFCDIPEFCDGKNAACPTDTFLTDGTDCQATFKGQSVGAQCASGVCTSRDLQCKTNSSGLETTSVCPGHDSDCQLYCQDGAGRCLMLNGFFQDGTPCALSGRCKAGQCEGSNFFTGAIDWMRRNLPAAISIGILAGLIVLSILVSIVRCIFCPQRRKKAPKVSELRVNPPIPLQPRGWVDPTPYNGNTGPMPYNGAAPAPAPYQYPPPAPVLDHWRGSPVPVPSSYSPVPSPVPSGGPVPHAGAATFTTITPVREVVTRSSSGSLREGHVREVVTSRGTVRRGD
ncbi:hypothetical protein HK097_008369 [Rhizophlyctis rosea]|uniref:Disintegrin and metalloproteinase domain-containing protein B n=1 Tax=Rhizophlyctis rosea TaxID=64517 RepID=A0AAD5SJK6_9FUNG|nr:hypothetical protein HK097_008369 [Rhizophlyctis rosea]